MTVRAQHLTFLHLLYKRLFCFCFMDFELLRANMVELIYAGITHKSAKRTRLAPFLLLANPSSSAALFCCPAAVAANGRRADERSLQGFSSTVRCPPTIIAESTPFRIGRPDDSPVRASAGTCLMLPRYPDIPAWFVALSHTLSMGLCTRIATNSFSFARNLTVTTFVRITLALVSIFGIFSLFSFARRTKNSFSFVRF